MHIGAEHAQINSLQGVVDRLLKSSVTVHLPWSHPKNMLEAVEAVVTHT